MATMVIQPYKAEPRYRLGWSNAPSCEYKIPFDIVLLGDIYHFLEIKETYPLRNEERIVEATRKKFNLPKNTPNERIIQILQQEMLREELKRTFSIEGSTYEEAIAIARREFDIPEGKDYVETRDILWGKILGYYQNLDEWCHDMAEGSHHN